MDGVGLQMFLNDKAKEHRYIGEEIKCALNLSSDPAKLVLETMKGFHKPHLKRAGLEYHVNTVRSSCLLLMEQLLELKAEVKAAVKEEARALATMWREKLRAESGSYTPVLGFLLLVTAYCLWWDFDKDQLRGLCEVVRHHKVVAELSSRLGFLRKRQVDNMTSQAQKEEPYIPPVKKAFVSPYKDPSIELCTLCKEMDANGLKSYLIKHAKDLKLLDEKVLDCLRLASDPAKLVFNVVEDFYLELDEFSGEANISCCNLLLEQLIKLSPHIDFILKDETMNFAARWKARLAMKNPKPFLVLGFLKFVAAYRLSSSFQADEILSLFTIHYIM